MLTKNELKELWRQHDFRPVKRLGQNFLVDKNVLDKILRNLDVDADDTVVEIGAGFGEITFDLARRAKRIFAVEKDRKICGILKSAFTLPRNVTLVEKDFLKLDLKELAGKGKVVIYGNIPYYATSPIMEKLFNNISLLKSIYFVLQKEVAERILARPGSKAIGRASLFAQYHTEPKRIFRIGKGCFYPAPEVESAFLKLGVPKKKKVAVRDERLLFDIIKKAYGQRRKTLLNSLSGPGLEKKALSPLLKSAKINPLARPETLSLADFARLADRLLI